LGKKKGKEESKRIHNMGKERKKKGTSPAFLPPGKRREGERGKKKPERVSFQSFFAETEKVVGGEEKEKKNHGGASAPPN